MLKVLGIKALLFVSRKDDIMEELFRQLDTLNLPITDYAITGSGPLYAHGLIPLLENDIDIIARNKAWVKSLNYKNPKTGELGDLIINLFNDRIQIFNEWSYSNETVNEIIDNAEMHGGYPFASLNHVLTWKKKLMRPKDILHIKLIEKYQKKRV